MFCCLGDTELDFHLTGQGCAPPSPSISALCANKGPPLVTISDVADDPKIDNKQEIKPEALKEGESTLVQIAAGKARPAINIVQERGVIDLEQDKNSTGEASSTPPEGGVQEEIWVRIEPPGDKYAVPNGDGLLPALTPPTNLSIFCSRQRPTMPAPSPPRPAASTASMGHSFSSSPAPAPSPSPASPDKSVHSEMYNTVFALHTLGVGEGPGWSDYLTRVRALWDGQFSASSPSSSAPYVSPSLSGGGRGQWRTHAPSSQRVSPGHPSPPAFPTPPTKCSSQPELRMVSERGRAVAMAMDGDVLRSCQGSSPGPKGSQGQVLQHKVLAW